MTGFLSQPKWGHLKDLHAAIKLCSHTILSGVATIAALGQQQEVRLAISFLSDAAHLICHIELFLKQLL